MEKIEDFSDYTEVGSNTLVTLDVGRSKNLVNHKYSSLECCLEFHKINCPMPIYLKKIRFIMSQ